jgi:hypothetical protein
VIATKTTKRRAGTHRANDSGFRANARQPIFTGDGLADIGSTHHPIKPQLTRIKLQTFSKNHPISGQVNRVRAPHSRKAFPKQPNRQSSTQATPATGENRRR